jgi:SIR2-like domain
MNLSELFDKTVFLLGAGASKDAGCLISSRMLSELKEEINRIAADDPVYGNHKQGFQELYKVIKPALEYQAELRRINADRVDFYHPNIEDYILILRKILNKDLIIPEPLVGSWSEKLLLLEIKYPNLFKQYLNFIYHCVIKWLTPENYEAAQNLLTPVKQLLQETTDEEFFINLFTLNYDLIFEKVFNSQNAKPLNNGFSENDWDTTSFDVQQTRINLFKIHGSLDWYLEKDDTHSLPNYEIAFNKLQPDERKPQLILGYESKLFSVDPFFTLLQKFIEKLDHANLVVVIGYSFFDAYLNNILIKFLNSRENRRLFIVDPGFSSKPNPSEAFTEYLKIIQTDNSTLNIYNYTSLASAKVQFFKSEAEMSGAKEFYQEFFTDKCAKLKDLYEQVGKEDAPF